MNVITNIYTILNLKIPDDVSFFRLDKTTKKNRPIKIVFSDEESAHKLLKRFSSDDLAEADEGLSKVSTGLYQYSQA